ncbi:MAG: AzlD domain-containing protein [Acidobacteriota bacterium]|nr:AzlD domain-containing protein [Acidobacteriota bacterium]NLH71112.1 AzlD domain-containing protein [Brooklawnia sp.]
MSLWSAILLMAGVTYLLRALPMVALRRRITNPWLLDFLHYVPYAVLTAMTVPAMILATESPISGLVALGVAVLVALRRGSLLLVALCAAGAVLATEALINLI